MVVKVKCILFSMLLYLFTKKGYGCRNKNRLFDFYFFFVFFPLYILLKNKRARRKVKKTRESCWIHEVFVVAYQYHHQVAL